MTIQEVASREESTLVSEIVNNIAWITFNNPDRMNAMSQEMWDNSAALLDQYGEDQNVRAIVLKGAGNRAFVAGADISK
ncbi:MAG: enoyl-CoA hydratase, partial [Rhodospirillaceae bacterium]|nr:enoyl-CoA hydratase [Rhodospirillaceae bacterium]